MVRQAAQKRRKVKTKSRATAEDAEVGRRVRAIRLERQVSQTALGKLLGVTFQQIQKYEKGANRIAAGRLQSLSEIFKVPISRFFPDQKGSSEYKSSLFDVQPSSDVLTLLRAYASLDNSGLKRSLVQLATRMAAQATKKTRS